MPIFNMGSTRGQDKSQKNPSNEIPLRKKTKGKRHNTFKVKPNEINALQSSTEKARPGHNEI